MLDILEGRTAVPGFSDYHADALNSRITHGYYCTVSLAGDSTKRSELERLQDLNEAWTICYRKPAPGWRLFGRFYVKGLFIATDFKDRHVVGRRDQYTAAAVSAIAELDSTFDNRQPVSGSSVEDYIIGIAQNVDEPPIY